MFVGVVAIPYIYEHIGVERIGVLTLIWALIGYFSIFDFGVGRAITQRIASLASQQEVAQKEKIATTGVFLTLLIGILGGLTGLAAIEFAGVEWINSAKNLDNEIYSSFLLACLAIPATTVTAGLRGILEAEMRFKAVNIIKLVLGLSNFLGPIASIAILGPNLSYIIASLVLTRYGILFAYYYCAKCTLGDVRKTLSIDESKELIRFGGWMTLSNIISPLMVVADRFLIAWFLGASIVAYYTIPADFMIRLLVIPAAITTTLFPTFSKNLLLGNHTKSLDLYKNSMMVIFVLMGGIAAIIIVGAKFGIAVWLGPEFAEKSYTVASVLAIGILFNSLAQVPHAYIQASGDSLSTALIHLVESALYLPALFILMYFQGITGAAIAWTLRALFDLALLHACAMRKNV